MKLLRELSAPHGRAKRGLFAAEGLRMCQSLLAAGAEPQKLFVEQRYEAEFAEGIPLEVVSPRSLERLSGFATAAGVIGIFKAPAAEEFQYAGRLTLALDTIQNPGNLGTLVRTADWFGVRQLLCSPGCADLYAPKALQATMGAIAHVAVRYEQIESVLDDLPRGFPVVALDMRGIPLSAFAPPAEGVILVGSEGRGLSDALRGRATATVAIPSVGRPAVDSLNAAVAAAIVLSHFCG